MEREQIARIIRQIMHDQEISRAKIAARIGYSAAMITFVIKGTRKPSERLVEALKKEFPTYFGESPKVEVISPSWNPLTIEFAVKVLTDSGWLAKHDEDILKQRRTHIETTPIGEIGWHSIEDLPPEPGMYRAKGYTRSGQFYSGVAILYADGYWYTTNGNRMPAPEVWREMGSYRPGVKTRTYE